MFRLSFRFACHHWWLGARIVHQSVTFFFSTFQSSNSPSAHWHSVPSPLYGRCQQLVVRREALGTLRSALALLKLVFSGRDYEEGITSKRK